MYSFGHGSIAVLRTAEFSCFRFFIRVVFHSTGVVVQCVPDGVVVVVSLWMGPNGLVSASLFVGASSVHNICC